MLTNKLLIAHDPQLFKATYKLGPEIGRGGFGVVFSGFRIADQETVAVKYVAKRHITDWTEVNLLIMMFAL
jgi:serine/threonine protein kinase